MKADDLVMEHFARMYRDGGPQRFGNQRVSFLSAGMLALLRADLIDDIDYDGAHRTIARMGQRLGAELAHDLPEFDDEMEARRASLRMARLAGLVEGGAHGEFGTADEPHIVCEWNESIDQTGPAMDHGKMGCSLMLGFMSGFLSIVCGVDIYFVEESCQGWGAQQCKAYGAPLDSWDENVVGGVMVDYGIDGARMIKPLDQVEREHIERTVELCSSRSEAAELLGIGEATLYRRLKSYRAEDE